MKYVSLFLIVFISPLSFSQDTVDTTVPEFKNGLSIGKKQQIAARAAFGIQKSYFCELGISYHRCNYSDVGFSSTNFYTAIEYPQSNIYALKAGWELNFMLFAFALEGKYQTDFHFNDFVITPKIGIGLFGELMLFYGYSISTNNRPFKTIGNHQISLVLTIGKDFLRYL